MEVRFAQDWFGPDARLYSRSILGAPTYTIPEEWKDQLPPRAVIGPFDGDRLVAAPKETLRDFDIDFHAARAETEIKAKAQADFENQIAGKRRPRS